MSLSTKIRPLGLRYYLGWLFFITGLLMPLFIPFITSLGINNVFKAFLIGCFLVGGLELFIVIAIAFWGKPTFDYFRDKIGAFFKGLAPSSEVSVSRYYIGLILLLSSFFPCWILAYAPGLVNDRARIFILISFDIVFILSFFILGGNFWEKIRALFIPNSININPN